MSCNTEIGMSQSSGSHQMEEENVESTGEDVELISDDWAFNVTLVNIAKQITEGDLKNMKQTTKGSNGLGKAVLEKIKHPTDLFDIMRDRSFLSPNNLLHLQAMLWAIGRRDLSLLLADFARNDRKKPLHFFASKEKPENGFTFLKIHIDGTNSSKQDVKNLRSLVAELLLTPVEYVYFVGYEPSSSIIVTFMVPMDNIQELKSLSEEDRGLLKSMHVDYIFIGEEEVSIIGEQNKPLVTLSSINEITKLMREKKRLERELQESLVLSSERQRALKEMQQKQQPLMPPKSPNQVSANQAPHSSHFEYNRGLPQKPFDQFASKGVKKGSQNIKPPGQISKESTARPTGPLPSPHQQMDFSLREHQSASECIMLFMKDASLELNEAKRKSLLDQTELKSDRREDVQKHPEMWLHV